MSLMPGGVSGWLGVRLTQGNITSINGLTGAITIASPMLSASGQVIRIDHGNVKTLVDAATVSGISADTNQSFTLVVTVNGRIISAPTTPRNGEYIRFFISRDPDAAIVDLVWNAIYQFAAAGSANGVTLDAFDAAFRSVLETDPSYVEIGFRYSINDDLWFADWLEVLGEVTTPATGIGSPGGWIGAREREHQYLLGVGDEGAFHVPLDFQLTAMVARFIATTGTITGTAGNAIIMQSGASGGPTLTSEYNEINPIILARSPWIMSAQAAWPTSLGANSIAATGILASDTKHFFMIGVDGRSSTTLIQMMLLNANNSNSNIGPYVSLGVTQSQVTGYTTVQLRSDGTNIYGRVKGLTGWVLWQAVTALDNLSFFGRTWCGDTTATDISMHIRGKIFTGRIADLP